MTSPRLRRFAVAAPVLAAIAAAWSLAVLASPSNTYQPPIPPRTNKMLLTGEKLWKSKSIVGPGGETCAKCHDGRAGKALEPMRLQRKVEDLDKIVYWELVRHCKNRVVDPDGPEIQALVTHLKHRFNLRAAPNDVPQALVGLEEAQQLFRSGEYDRAERLAASSLRLAQSDDLRAEFYLLLGCIYQVLGRDEEMVRAFRELLRLAPDVQVEPEIYSPKTIEIIDTLRHQAAEDGEREVPGGQRSRERPH